jgi:hypothetical protein
MIRLLVLALCLTGCTSSAYLTGTFDSGSGYDPGAGVRVETTTDHGAIRPRLDATVSYQPKRDADTGYTYSGAAGLQWHGRVAFVEAGWIAYGYESRFTRCGSDRPVRRPCVKDVWRGSESSPYLRLGAEWPEFLFATLYVPPSDDQYKSDSLSIEARWIRKRLTVFVAPSFYRYTYNNEVRTDAGLTAGIGKRW